jgi:hypothetical protein
MAALGVEHGRATPGMIRTMNGGNAPEFIAGLTSGGLAGRRELSALPARAPDVAAISDLLQGIVRTPPARLRAAFEAPEGELLAFVEQVRDLLAAAGRLLDMGDVLPEPDLIIATDLESLMAGVIAKMRADTPLLYDASEDFAASPGLPGPLQLFWRGIERTLAQHTDGCFAASDSLAAHVSGRLGRAVTPLSGGWTGDILADAAKKGGAITPAAQRDGNFAKTVFDAMPDELPPGQQVALEAYVARHRMMEVAPLIVNGVSTLRWNAQTMRVDEALPEFAQMSGGKVGLSVLLPFTTDVNCMFLALEGHDAAVEIEIESFGPGGSSAPAKVALDGEGELFLPWTGNLTSRIVLKMPPVQGGTFPQVRAFRVFTLCAGMG